MTLMDADDRYGAVSRAVHWIMAVLLLVMLASEVWFEALEHSLSEASLMAWHQSLGLTIFGLVIFRGLWRWLNRARLSPAAHWATMAKLGHLALYALMILMPLSGLATSLGEGDPVTFSAGQSLATVRKWNGWKRAAKTCTNYWPTCCG